MKFTAIPIFAAIAVIVGLLVSYFPPTQNAAGIWSLVTLVLAHFARDLTTSPDAVHSQPIPPSTPTASASPNPVASTGTGTPSV